MNPKEDYQNKIDDYKQTIHAIVGFTHLYRYDDDTKKMKDDVLIFQGRRFNYIKPNISRSEKENTNFVTPDFGILLPKQLGVIGEVKKSFGKDQSNWIDAFKQLMKYDNDLIGWPSSNEMVQSHDVVLVLHQTRSAAVKKYYEDRAGSEIQFTKPFTMIQFNMSGERQPYYFFQKILGSLTDKYNDERLFNGVSVPMFVFIEIYSTVKLYDGKPPIPYLVELIYTNVVLSKALENPKFITLRRNQKIDILLEINEIVEELNRGFSFRKFYTDNTGRQSKIPKKEWVEEACEVLVKTKEAVWTDQSKTSIKIFFRKYDDTINHFIETYSQTESYTQTELFERKDYESN